MNDIVDNLNKFKKGWTGGLPETPCGNGSRLNQTVEQRKWIPGVVEAYNIFSIADIGAGDLNWIKEMELPAGVEYWAYDLVPRQPEVIKFDLVKEVPAPVDMIMCLWVLNHLPYHDAVRAISNIKKSGSRYLLTTNRERWREDQPNCIDMPYIERMVLNDDGDSIRLVDLEAI